MVGGVGGPGPGPRRVLQKLHSMKKLFHCSVGAHAMKPFCNVKTINSICFHKNKVYLVFPELGDYGTLVIKTVLGVSDTYWGQVL